MNSDVLSMMLISLGILFLVLLVSREIVCWYFKINKVIGLLQTIAENTSKDEE